MLQNLILASRIVYLPDAGPTELSSPSMSVSKYIFSPLDHHYDHYLLKVLLHARSSSPRESRMHIGG